MIKRFCLFVAVLMAFAACTNFEQEVDASILEADVKSLAFESGSGSFVIKIRSGSEWDVTVPSWMKATSIASVSGSPFEWNVRGEYEANDQYDARNGSVVFKTNLKQVTVPVSQKGKPVIIVTGIKVNPTSLSMSKGETKQLTATVEPSNATNRAVSWKSSNTSVATVDASGKVTGVNTGTATITVTTEDGGKTASCSVSVSVPVTAIAVNPSQHSMTEGDSYTLSVSFYPSNASNKTVTWSSNYTPVATVNSSGTVKAIKEGSAIITARSEDGGYTSTCKITVVKATVAVTNVSVSPTSLNMTVGDKQKLTATVSPADAYNKNVSWKSSNNNVASVDSGGTVSAVSAGTATITVTTQDGNKTATCQVTVKAATVSVTGVTVTPSSLTLPEGQTHGLTATVSPTNATNKNLSWSSNNTNVATVDQNGKVTAITPGYANITVKTEDGNKTATCYLTVQTASPNYVDLGLSVKWATFNIGGSSPEHYGRYYAWGEVNTKSTYSWGTYTRHSSGSSSSIYKYYSGDGRSVLEMQDDIARTSWGSKWRMPTKVEIEELLNNCTWKWESLNGVYGYRVTSYYNSKSIFIPAAGYREGTNIYGAGSDGEYWSSSLSTSGASSAGALLVNQTSRYIGNMTRYYGYTVRAVYGDPVVYVKGVSLDQTQISVNVGSSKTLVATVTPSDATNKSVTWSSSYPSVATVDSNGNVTGVKAGSATVKVTTVDGNFSASCQVTVVQPSQGLTAVDLKLPSGVKWGSCNLGAANPEDAGNYYAWGEITPKNQNFDWSHYLWSNGNYLKKYNLHSAYGYNGYVDNISVLQLSDDAANASLGGQWRMPTRAEVEELLNYCDWSLTIKGGSYGFVFSRGGNSIFIPASGYNTGSYVANQNTTGHYWTSTLRNEHSKYAMFLAFGTNLSPEVGFGERCYGNTIRPVYGPVQSVPVSSVSLNKSSMTLSKGSSETLTATVNPSNATNKSVTWKSSNTSVATVDSYGKVTGVNAGTTTVTVTTVDGGKTATCTVTVVNGSIPGGDPEGFDESNGQW